MNVFRFAGDMTHLISILVLLLKIYAAKSCSDVQKNKTPAFCTGSSCVQGLFFLTHIYFGHFRFTWEAVAILPQLVLLQSSGNVDNLAYVFFLGAYRAFYIPNWIYGYFTGQHFTRWISCIAGLLQTALHAVFFYYYFISWKNNVKLKLPA